MKSRDVFLFAVAVVFCLNSVGRAQIKNTSIEFGMMPTLVVGNDKITSPLASSTQNYRGGGFFGFNNAFFLKAIFEPSLNSRFSFPVGVEYIFYRAYHRVPISRFVAAYLTHSIDLASVNIGTRYSFFKLPFANVLFFGELTFAGNFVGASNYSVRLDYELLDSSSLKTVVGKQSVFRLGGGIRFGFLGEIESPWYVNIFTGVNYVNLLGRNNSRGELLTPTNVFEPIENPVYNFTLGFSIIYKFK
ncbi:MAG: hypothetical protein ACUVQ1_06970 [Candidatus Kapaibacteriales bacterium]